MISIKNLSKSYIGMYPDFTANPGDFILICGASGSGKTTICEMIAGFTPYDTGNISIDSKDLKNINVFQYLHYISQIPDHNLIGPTAEEEIKLWVSTKTVCGGRSSVFGISHPTTEDLIPNIDQTTPIWKLSFGQKKALAFHCITLVKRQIWLLDEPFAGLDKETLHDIKAKMKSFIKEDGIIIATSHDSEQFLDFHTYNMRLVNNACPTTLE